MRIKKLFPLFFILIAAVLYQVFFNGPEPEIAEPPKVERVVDVWRSVSDLNVGERIVWEDVEKTTLTESEARELGVISSADLIIPGASYSRVALTKGDIVLPRNIAKNTDHDYIEFMEIGENVLFPLSISSRNLVRDYIQPGQRIDIVKLTSPNANLASTDNYNNITPVESSVLARNILMVSIRYSNSIEQEENIRRVDEVNTSGKVNIVVAIPRRDIAKFNLASMSVGLQIYPSMAVNRYDMQSEHVNSSHKTIREVRGVAEMNYNPRL